MKVNDIIERAEKFRGLGRFDKKSAMSFINDALYDIAKHQAIKRDEIYYEYQGIPIETEGKIIKVESIKLNGVESKDYSARVMQDNKILLFKKDKDGIFQKIEFDDGVRIATINIIYTGYIPVLSVTEIIDFPDEFESAIVYYVRSKMLEESGEIEMSTYFMGQFMKELIMKSSPKVDVVSRPSKYSLL